jgi:RNA polymerase sigma-70 factor (ECF subfamily)
MMMIAHLDRLRAYRAHPDAETLVGLLEGCKGRVYNVCYQVLRHVQDAEEAAQETLIKIAEEVGTGADLRHFDPWMYRVAYTTALNVLKQRKDRVAREKRRALMAKSASPPDEAFEAVHEAVEGLDDDSRSTVIQFFFEQRSLEEMARERGCSAVAVWKRVDKAKTALRRTLARSGLTAFIPQVDMILQSLSPASAPAGLVSKAVIAKVTHFLAPSSSGVAATVGGMAMTGKGLSFASVAALALFMFFAAIGGAYLIRASKAAAQQTDLSSAGKRSMARSAEAPPGAPGNPAASPAPASRQAEVPRGAPPAVKKEPLLARLQHLVERIRERGELFKRSRKEPDRSEDLERQAAQLSEQCQQEWRALREEAFEDPGTYVSFLRTHDGDVFQELLCLLSDVRKDNAGSSLHYPKAIVDGLVDLIVSGTKIQKALLIDIFVAAGLFYAGGAQKSLSEACVGRLLAEEDPKIRSGLFHALNITDQMDFLKGVNGTAAVENRLDVLREVWQNNSSRETRQNCLLLLSKARSPAAEDLFHEKVEEVLKGQDRDLKQVLPGCLEERLRTRKLGEEDRCISSLKSALWAEPSMCLNLASASLVLPLAKASPFLEEARGRAPDQESKAAIDRVLGLIRSGESRIDVLKGSLGKP